MTTTPNEVAVASENDEIRMSLRETRTRIETIDTELEKLIDIVMKPAGTLTGDEKSFLDECCISSGDPQGHRQKLKQELKELKETENKLLGKLPNTSEVCFCFFL